MVKTVELCESCGNVVEAIRPAKNLEDQFINDARQQMSICVDCFKKRYKVATKKRSGYGGTIYELEERSAPRFGLGSQRFTCLKCDWVAWTEAGLAAHIEKKHPR